MAAVIQEGLAYINRTTDGSFNNPVTKTPGIPVPKHLLLPTGEHSGAIGVGNVNGLSDTADNALQASRNILLDSRNLPGNSSGGLSGLSPAGYRSREDFVTFSGKSGGQRLLQPDMSPMDFNQALINNRLPHDSMQFLAHAMSPRQAVWWGADCLDNTGAKWTQEEETLARAARAWSYSPGERTLDGVAKALPTVPQGSPVAMLGKAVLIVGSDPQFLSEGAESLAVSAENVAELPKLPASGSGTNGGVSGGSSGLPEGLSLIGMGAFLSKVESGRATTAEGEGSSGIGQNGNVPAGAGSRGLVQRTGSFSGTATGTAATGGGGRDSTATDAGMSRAGGSGNSSNSESSSWAGMSGTGNRAESGAFSHMMMWGMGGMNSLNSMGPFGTGVMPYTGRGYGGMGGMGAFDNAMMTPSSAMGSGLDYATNAMMSPVETGDDAVTGAWAAPMDAVAGALSGPAMVCSQVLGGAVEGLATVAMLANTAIMFGAGGMAIYGTFSSLGTATYSNYTAVTDTYTATVDDMSDIT